MPRKAIDIHWPTGGLNKRIAFQGYHPGGRYWTTDCNNVLPDCSILGRERGGSRPGLGKVFAQQLGSGNPIRSIGDVSYIVSGAVTTRTVAIANGLLYYESAVDTTITAATMSSLTLNSTVPLDMADHQQILYIADYASVLFNATDGVVASTTTFTSATAGSFTGTNNNDFALVITDGGTGPNEVQTLTMTGTPTGGTFTLSLVFAGDLYTTNPLPYSASAANVATALNAQLGASSVSCGGGAFPGSAITVTFDGTNVDNINHEMITADPAGLTGGTVPQITVAQTTRGGPATEGTYKITTSGSTLTVTPSMGVSTATGVSFNVVSGPKKWNPSTNTMSQWTAAADKGSVPAGCKLLTMWRDRMVLAGDLLAPHMWYMSRQGDPLDWDYAVVNDAGAAIAGNNAPAGMLGEDINCLIPHSDDCLIFGCNTSVWIMRGDPGFGGQLDRLSSEIGIVGKDAWCYTPEGFLYVMTQDGVYQMAPGCGSTLRSISREVLPEELLAIPTTTFVSMAYDVRLRMIHLTLTPATAGSPTHYMLDVKTTQDDSGAQASFWPITVNSNYDAFSIVSRRDKISAHSVVYWGCRDGYIRRLQTNLAQDDTTNYSSYIQIGPLKMAGDNMHDGVLHEMMCTLAANSGPVTWQVKVGPSAEEANAAVARRDGVFWNDGFNPTARPRLSGGAGFVRLGNKYNNSEWALESLTLTVERGGLRRL